MFMIVVRLLDCGLPRGLLVTPGWIVSVKSHLPRCPIHFHLVLYQFYDLLTEHQQRYYHLWPVDSSPVKLLPDRLFTYDQLAVYQHQHCQIVSLLMTSWQFISIVSTRSSLHLWPVDSSQTSPLPAVWPEKIAESLEKLPKKDFTRKIKDFDTFIKIF